MVYEDMKRLTKPFRPFRITTTSGESFDVWQREGFLLANWHIVVGLLKSGTDEYEHAPFMLTSATSPTSNTFLSPSPAPRATGRRGTENGNRVLAAGEGVSRRGSRHSTPSSQTVR